MLAWRFMRRWERAPVSFAVPVLVALLSLPVCCGGEGSNAASGATNGAGTTGGTSQTDGGAGGMTTAAGSTSTTTGSTTVSTGAAGGGTATDGGTTTGSGGVGSGGTTTVDPFDACVSYGIAVCERFEQCLGRGGPCSPERYSLECPGHYTAPGNTRTPSMLLACALEWAEHPCEMVAANIPPDCVIPGTRAGGEACAWGSQCDSSRCATPGAHPDYPGFNACGTCQHQFGPEEDCTGEGVCPIGQSCDAETARCAVPAPTTPEPLPALGEPCTQNCAQGLCLADDSQATTGICGQLPVAGEACKNIVPSGFASPRCSPENFCNTNRVCEPRPTAPEACGIEYGENTFACQSGNYCALALGEEARRCVLLPEAGDACVMALQGFVNYTESTLDSAILACSAGVTCRCDDDSCAAGTCISSVPVGASCDAAHLCGPGADCIDEQCQATGDLFEALCGMP